jgi:hypothetical protein
MNTAIAVIVSAQVVFGLFVALSSRKSCAGCGKHRVFCACDDPGDELNQFRAKPE